MSVPSTREPQKILVSQIICGLNAVRFWCSCKATRLRNACRESQQQCCAPTKAKEEKR